MRDNCHANNFPLQKKHARSTSSFNHVEVNDLNSKSLSLLQLSITVTTSAIQNNPLNAQEFELRKRMFCKLCGTFYFAFIMVAVCIF